MNPAFEVCVWTIAGRSRRINRTSSASAVRSASGATSRPSAGTSTTRHPRRRASASDEASDSRNDVARMQS